MSEGPTVETLRRIAKHHGSEMLVLFQVNPTEGTYKMVSYGRNPGLCSEARKIGDRLADWIDSGHLIR